MRLKKQHLQRHYPFFKQVLQSTSLKQLRKTLSKASYLQLQTLIKVLAAIALKQVPSTDKVAKVYFNSRKKRLLRKHFSSWNKVSQLLATRSTEEWSRVLSELAHLINPSFTLFYKS